MRIARLGDPPASDTGPTRVLRRHEAQEGHQLPRMGEASDVADFGDEADRRDKRHTAQRLERVHDRRPTPIRGKRPELVREAPDALFGVVDRVPVLLQRDVLWGQRKTQIGQPASVDRLWSIRHAQDSGAPAAAGTLSRDASPAC